MNQYTIINHKLSETFTIEADFMPPWNESWGNESDCEIIEFDLPLNADLSLKTTTTNNTGETTMSIAPLADQVKALVDQMVAQADSEAQAAQPAQAPQDPAQPAPSVDEQVAALQAQSADLQSQLDAEKAKSADLQAKLDADEAKIGQAKTDLG
jgi:hypothetical protein